METMSDKLARFAAGLSYEDIPGQVIEKSKLHLLDALGIGLAATREPYADAVTKTARDWGGAPQATVWRYGDKLPVAHASMVNGSYVHGLDFDDTHTDSITHMSACVVPTALAAGEAAGASGQEILAAMVTGYEVIARIGGAAPGAFHAEGYHATPICGAFGAAAVMGRLMNHSPEAIANAFGVCGSQAAGIQEFLDDGSWVKRFHPGWASHAGVTAAQIAAPVMFTLGLLLRKRSAWLPLLDFTRQSSILRHRANYGQERWPRLSSVAGGNGCTPTSRSIASIVS